MNRNKYARIWLCLIFACVLVAPVAARKSAKTRRSHRKNAHHKIAPKPDNATGKIVFLRNGGFHIMNLDGSRQEVLPKDRLMVGKNIGGDKVLTPDGTHIVHQELIMPRDMFSSESSFSGIRYVLSTKDVRTSKVAVIFDAYGMAVGSIISPDSKRVAYITGENHNPYVTTLSLFVCNIDGSDNKKVEVELAPGAAETDGKVTYSYSLDFSSPFFSADGTSLFFPFFPNDWPQREKTSSSGWYQFRVDGSKPQKLISNPIKRDLTLPSSPDGKREVFQDGDRCKDVYDIYIKDVNNRVVLRLTTNSPTGAENPDECSDEKMHSDFHPTFAPDGRILFVSDRDGNNEIYIMDIDGKNQKRLTFNKVDDDFPQWRVVKKIKP